MVIDSQEDPSSPSEEGDPPTHYEQDISKDRQKVASGRAQSILKGPLKVERIHSDQGIQRTHTHPPRDLDQLGKGTDRGGL